MALTRTIRTLPTALALLVPLAVGCSSDAGTGPGGADGYMTARIDGDAWSSDDSYIDLGFQSAGAGSYIIHGQRVSGSSATAINIALSDIAGPGTYPLGTGAGVAGGIAILGESTGGWLTPLSGSAGTITLSTVSATRLTGTFSFTADAVSGTAAGSRSVTEGRFDVPSGAGVSVAAPPPHAGNRISATIGGTAWSPATVILQQNVSTLWGFAASNTEYTLSVSLQQVTAPGTYALTTVVPLRLAGISAPPGGGPNCCWGGTTAGATGSVTIATWTSDRVTGTFSFTLPPVTGTQASGPLAVTNGVFDVGLPPQ